MDRIKILYPEQAESWEADRIGILLALSNYFANRYSEEGTRGTVHQESNEELALPFLEAYLLVQSELEMSTKGDFPELINHLQIEINKNGKEIYSIRR